MSHPPRRSDPSGHREKRTPKRTGALQQTTPGSAEAHADYQPLGAFGGSFENRPVIERSTLCGCHCCRHLFTPEEIDWWIDETDGVGLTAMCPKCGLDGVVGSASPCDGDLAFLRELTRRWGVRFPAEPVRVAPSKRSRSGS